MTFSTPISSSFFSGPLFKYLLLKKNFSHDFQRTKYELKKTEKYKLIVYSPECLSDNLRTFLAESGAGVIGNYTHCSFTTKVSTYCKTFPHHHFIKNIDRIETVVKENQIPDLIKGISRNKQWRWDIIRLYTLEPNLSIKKDSKAKFKPFQTLINMFQRFENDETFKLVVYAPEPSATKIKKFIECNEMLHSSFSNDGTGRWCKVKPNGEKAAIDEATEERIEMTVKKNNIPQVISILKRFHQYEEMGFDIIKPKSLFAHPLRTFSILKKKITTLAHTVLPRIKPLFLLNFEKKNPNTKIFKLKKSSNVQIVIYTPKSKAHQIHNIITPQFAHSTFSIEGNGNSNIPAITTAADCQSDTKNQCKKEKIEIVINEKLYPELINEIKRCDSVNVECDVLRLYDINDVSVNFIEKTYSSNT